MLSSPKHDGIHDLDLSASCILVFHLTKWQTSKCLVDSTHWHNLVTIFSLKKINNCELSDMLIREDSSWSMACFIIWTLQEQSDQHKIIHTMDFYSIWSQLHWGSLLNRVSVFGNCFWFTAIYEVSIKWLKNTSSLILHH